jgi:hypothetical protein
MTDFWVKGFERHVKQGWFASLTALAYLQRGDILVIAGGGGQILLVNLQTLQASEPKKLVSGIRCLCFGQSGQLFVGLDNGSIACLSSQGVQLLSAKISRKPITSLLWSEDYGLLVAAEDRQLRRLAPETLEEICASEKLRWVGHDLALIEQGQQLVAAGSDNNLHLIDPELLAPLLVVHAGTARQTRNSCGHGQLVTAGQDGSVTILDAVTHHQRRVLPIANGNLAGVQIVDAAPALFLADQQGVVQEWDLQTLEPLSALQVDGSTKALTVSGSGDVLAVCTDRSVQVFLRASQLTELACYQQQLASRQSFLSRIEQFFRRLVGRPLPALPPPPDLPPALVQAALHTDPEIREIERTTSEALVQAYRGVAADARKVDWKAVGQAIDKQQRHQLEIQRLELRRLREERLSKTLEEAQRRRQFHHQQVQARELAIRQAKAEERSKKFWEGVGRLMGNMASTAASSAAAGTWVSSYTRRDGTRVRGYRRR